MKKLTDQEVVTILRQDLADAENFNYEVEASRGEALDYYNGTGVAVESTPGDICDGRSRLVSTDVADMVDACMSMMMPSLSDGVCEFEPSSDDEEEQCQIESDIVNYYIWDKGRGYNIFRSALFDALLQKNCCLRVWWDEEDKVDVQEYEDLSMDEFQVLAFEAMQDPQKEIVDFDADTLGLSIQTTRHIEMPRFEVFPPEQIRINADHDSACVDDARFVCRRPSNVTESDLIEQGYDKTMVSDLAGYEWNDDAAAVSRSVQVDENFKANETSGPNRILDYNEIFTFIDVNGDGISERRRIIMVGDTILENDEVDCSTIVTGSCLPVPHQFWGMSLFDKLKGVQDTKTQFLRAVVDNVNLNINNRLMVNPDQIHNPDELMTSRPGGIIQVKRRDAVQALATPPVDQSSMLMMEYMDKMRTERAGAALDMTSENLPVGNNATAHGTERIMSSIELRQQDMVTSFTEYVLREVFFHTHKLLRKNASGPVSARVSNEFVTSDPRQWPERDNINIVVGATAGERARKAAATQAVIQDQNILMQLGGGGIMTNPKGLYNARVDMARFSGLNFPEQYYLDPESPEAQQAVMQQAQQEQQAQQAQMQQQQQMMEFQMQLTQMAENTKMQKIQADATIKMQQLQLEMLKLQAEATNLQEDNEHEEQKLELQARIEMAKEETKRMSQEYEHDQFWADMDFKYEELLKDTQVEYAKIDREEAA